MADSDKYELPFNEGKATPPPVNPYEAQPVYVVNQDMRRKSSTVRVVISVVAVLVLAVVGFFVGRMLMSSTSEFTGFITPSDSVNEGVVIAVEGSSSQGCVVRYEYMFGDMTMKDSEEFGPNGWGCSLVEGSAVNVDVLERAGLPNGSSLVRTQ